MKGKTALPTPGPRYQALIELLRTAESLWRRQPQHLFSRWDLSPQPVQHPQPTP